MDCYQHPGTASTATCIACAKPICAECSETVAGHTMCRPCVAATQERLTAEGAAAPAGTAPPSAPPPTPSSAPYADATAISGQPVAPAAAPTAQAYQPPLEPCGPVQYVKAIAFGIAAAVVGAIIWDKIVLATGWQVGIVAVLLGALVGIAVRTGADGRPGAALPWIGAAIAGFSILFGNFLLTRDLVSGAMGGDLLSLTFRSMDVMDWVFVAIGVYEGWIIPHRLNQEAQTS